MTKAQEVLESLAPRVAPEDMVLLVEAVCSLDAHGYNGISAQGYYDNEGKVKRLWAILVDLGYDGGTSL